METEQVKKLIDLDESLSLSIEENIYNYNKYLSPYQKRKLRQTRKLFETTVKDLLFTKQVETELPNFNKNCPSCGRVCKSYRSENWGISFKQGEIEVPVACFKCKHCKTYFFM